MTSITPPQPHSLSSLRTTSSAAAYHHRLPSCLLLSHRNPGLALDFTSASSCFHRLLRSRRSFAVATLMANSVPPRSGVYTVGDFMTRKKDLHVVKPTTTVDEALETLVENRITGFPVIDDNWKLVGLVSDYDLLALDSVSAYPVLFIKFHLPLALADYFYYLSLMTELLPQFCSSYIGWAGYYAASLKESLSNLLKCSHFTLNWGIVGKLLVVDLVVGSMLTFNEVQKLLSKTNGKVVGDLMTPAPVVVRESTNLEDAARFSLILTLDIIVILVLCLLVSSLAADTFMLTRLNPWTALFDVSDYC
ncbi:hypothetical protein TEA_027587 [Camellia sinensis var. sinensis]|uniref:CBS domain-containing protein n=1 Tax=Camellia sinensis var. sinensis TaxID=542762 RepID=A0A4S4ENF0_CAMSN|nr:hypothetical protein TEA_027587 [Camellia sinensis var. sinensis]